ncbi:MAG: 3-hydroxyacyl-CoA dehydrogenase family protein [Verrucomicrobiota bacterium]
MDKPSGPLTLGVVGSGQMGGGIAMAGLITGHDVYAFDQNEEAVQRLMTRADSADASQLPSERDPGLPPVERPGRLHPVSSLEGLASCDVIIEAVQEDMATKKSIFSALDECCPQDTIFASNTSALSITEMGAATQRPDRVGGLHFHIPVTVMHVVEVINGEQTSQQTVDTLSKVARNLGKQVVLAKDTPGFIVNRLLVPYILDAIRVVEQGTADRDAVDISMRMACRHPMGPLQLGDFIGLDTLRSMSLTLFNGLGEERFRPPELLEELVSSGYFGAKNGRGFYNYKDPQNEGDRNANITARFAELLQ